MIKKERPSKTYMELIRKADKEMYVFWNIINSVAIGTYPLETILVNVLKTKVIEPIDVESLSILDKQYPGTTITNCSGMPILTIKLS